jgi:hypothetical protein
MLIGEGRRFGWVLLAGVLNGVENKPVGTILAETRQRLVYLMSNAFADSTGETTDDTEEHRGLHSIVKRLERTSELAIHYQPPRSQQ